MIAFPLLETSDTAVEPSNSSATGQLPRGRHRRSRASVTQDDLETFRAGYLGVTREALQDIQAQREAEQQLPVLDAALSNLTMSPTSSSNSNANTSTASSGASPAFSALYENNQSSMPRSGQGIPPAGSAASQNGVPGGMTGLTAGMPMNAGQEMDLNYVYQMITELSDVLAHNRDTTRNIIRASEEIAVSTFSCFLRAGISLISSLHVPHGC